MAINRQLNDWSSGLPNPDLVPQYRGVWVAVPYELADVVTYNGGLYIAHDNTTRDDAPTVSPKWQPIVDSTQVIEITNKLASNLPILDSLRRDLTEFKAWFTTKTGSALDKLTQALSNVSAFINTSQVRFDEIVRNHEDSLEQAREEVLKLAVVDPRFISTTTASPRLPTYAEFDAHGGQDAPPFIGSRLTQDGSVQLIWYEWTTGHWREYGKPLSINKDTFGLIRFAANYGVKEGADLTTLMDAIKDTPDGGTLICPNVKIYHRVATDTWLIGRKNLTIYGNGLYVEATADLPDFTGMNGDGNKFTGGFKFFNCKNIRWYNTTYDGRLDLRTPGGRYTTPDGVEHIGADVSGSGPKSGWNILSRCENIELIDCAGNRCMMDGVCIGGPEHEFLPTGTPPLHEVQDVAKNITLKNFIAEFNYRQGLSVVGVNGLTIDGGRYSDTGKLPDGTDGVPKWTLPCAGIDFEAFFVTNSLNLNVRLINSPETTRNKGVGLMIHSGTRGLRCESLWTHHNDGEGVTESGSSGVMDNYVNCVSEYNGLSTTWKNCEVYRAGIRPVQRGIIRANNGIGGLYIDQPCLDPDVQDMKIIATAPAPGSRCGNVIINTGGQTNININTGEFFGWNPDGSDITVPLPASTGGIIKNNLLVDCSFDTDYFAAFDVNAPGADVSNNIVYDKTGLELSSTRAIKITARLARDNYSEGYKLDNMINASGAVLNNRVVPFTPIVDSGNRQINNTYTPEKFGMVSDTLIDLPDMRLILVSGLIFFDPGEAVNVTQGFYTLPELRLGAISGTATIDGTPVPAIIKSYGGDSTQLMYPLPAKSNGLTRVEYKFVILEKRKPV